MGQLQLLTSWRDYRTDPPADGEKVVCYTEILDPEDDMPMFKKHHIAWNGRTLMGPAVRRVEKKFIEDGSHRPIALWQGIEGLPGYGIIQPPHLNADKCDAV